MQTCTETLYHKKLINQEERRMTYNINENDQYIAQLKELVAYFSKIENTHIRQYCINIIKEVQEKSYNLNVAQEYISDVMGYQVNQ